MNRRPGDHPSEGRISPTSRRLLWSGATTPFVGRVEELHHLTAALDLAAEGQGSTIFLVGQPGIGKTRLAREALALAKGRGFTTIEGRAFPLEVGLAYAPFVDAVGPLLRSLEPCRLAALVSGLPDLGHLFGVLRIPPPSFPAEGLGDPALEKTRLFEAVLRLLERLTQEAPLAFFLDDMQWADPATIELLHYLARGLSGQPALLLITCSVDALETAPGLRALVASLERNGLARELIVPRLKSEAVGRMAQGILGGEAPGELLALLDARSGGTPLYVEALIGALLDSGALVRTERGWVLGVDGALALPQTVRHLILERLERMTPADRHVLDLIGVMGDATSHTILRAVSSLDEDTLLEAVRRLRISGLVVESIDASNVAYSITHPLIQEVAYAELPEMARRRAHLAAIEAIEKLPANDPLMTSGQALNRLARHYLGAGPDASRGRALTALVAAGDRALALYANEEAARHFEAALAMVREGRYPTGLVGCGDPQWSWLLERLGEAWERIGRREAAVEAWNEALAAVERSAPSEERTVAATRLRRQLAQAEWDRGRFDLANAHLRTGLAALVGHEPCQELVDLYYVRFHLLWRVGDVAGAAETVAKLLSLAEQLASPLAEAEANQAAANVYLGQGDIIAARDRACRVLTIGESASGGQDLGLCCRAHIALVSTGMRLGDYNFMRDHAERGLAIARRLGAPHMEVFFRFRLAYAHYLAGAWEESLSCNLEAVALARRVGHPRDLAHSLAEWAMILAFQGDLSKAEACVAEARLTFGSPSGAGPADRGVFGLIDIAEAAVALERGQLDRALGTAKGFLVPSEPAQAPSGLTASYVQIGLMLLAETQVAAGEPEAALETARRLIGLGPGGTPYLTALAARAEGLARRALGQRGAALACVTSAQETFAALEMPFEAAKCLVEQAAIAGPGRPGLAVRAAQQGLAIFERLGAQRYAERARRLLRGLGITPLATRRPRLGGVTVSERELQIARLVARGLTTTEIASRLTLSPRTVTTHLNHIYTRLSINTRTALARLVMEAGLLLSVDENT